MAQETLDFLLPGGTDLWLRCSDEGSFIVSECSISPLNILSACLFLVSRMSNMSQSCLAWCCVGSIAWIAMDAFGLVIPLYIIQILIGLLAAIHLPILSRKQAAGMLIAVGLIISAAYFEDAKAIISIVVFLASLIMATHRVWMLVITLKASTPANLFFPIISHVMPRWSFSHHVFFRTDSPPESIALKREKAFEQLKTKWGEKFSNSVAESSYLCDKLSDLRFCAGKRVFVPYQEKLEDWCDPATVVARADRTDLIDVDGNRLTDVSGSYGVNVCGYEEYKRFIATGWELTKDTGCVLGPLHPLVRENVDMLRSISKKQEVSFHMSGTEAVMCALRLARFNSGKRYVVIFGGAYHGWWDGVQSLAGNERTPMDVLTLKDMDAASLMTIRARGDEIAAVVVNPLQGFHPNQPPPSDVVLASNVRGVSDSTRAYMEWLQKLRVLCTESKVTLVFDEVYTGFRLAPGGAQEYFNIDADMVVYGKTLGGGIPNGVVCGPSELMNRSDPTKPLRAAYIVGTFAAHPLLLGAMNTFLKWVTSPQAKQQYLELRKNVADWVQRTNNRLEKEFEGDAPLAIGAYASVWTMLFKRPGRYHWMLQYYLKDEGLCLSWVGTGRLSFSLDFTPKDLDSVTDKIIKACHRMEDDGWWWKQNGKQPSQIAIKLKLGFEVLRALVNRIAGFR